MIPTFPGLHPAVIFFCIVSLLSAFFISPAFADNPAVSDESILELMHLEDYEKSLDQLEKAHSLFPYNEAIRNKLAAAHYDVGQRHLKRKQYDEAARSFDRARELFPDHHEYGILRGIALYLGKRYDEAAYELERTRQAGGDDPTLLLYQGLVCYDTGNLAGALDAWDKALALDPGNKAIRELMEKARRESMVESRMEKGYRSIFVISYDGGTRSDLADGVLKTLESAFSRVGSDFSHYPSAQVPVILYTREDYRSVTTGPEWSGGLYDGKVRLPIGGARELSPLLRGVLFHEYTHAVVRELTKGNCPTWLNEGLAEVEGRKEYDPPLDALEAAAKTGGFLPFADLEKSLASLGAKDAQLAYQQSYAMVRFLISAYGWHKVQDILANLGKGMDTATAIARAFEDLGLDYQGIIREWQAQAVKESGS